MGCYDIARVWEVRKIQGLLFKLGLELDVFIGTAFVNTYPKFRLIVEVQEVFEVGVLWLGFYFYFYFFFYFILFFFFYACGFVWLLRKSGKMNENYRFH